MKFHNVCLNEAAKDYTFLGKVWCPICKFQSCMYIVIGERREYYAMLGEVLLNDYRLVCLLLIQLHFVTNRFNC